MGRPPKKVKVADANEIAPVKTQEVLDWELLNEKVVVNPFTQPLMKRTKLWEEVAVNLNCDLEEPIHNERRCRERVKKLLTNYRARQNKITGDGTKEPTACDVLLAEIAAEDDKYEQMKEDEKEKEHQKELARKKIMSAALERLNKSAKETEETIDEHGGDPDPGEEPKMFAASSSREEAKKKICLSPRRSYARQKAADTAMDYINKKAEMNAAESDKKSAMQYAELEDRKEERKLKLAQLEVDKQKLENNERDSARWAEKDERDSVRRAEMDQRMLDNFAKSQETFMKTADAMCKSLAKSN
ncbi:hypothetical protein BV898_17589 [Hypsibius exemplaris]|uniref:Uncharacterized protein n=1 Tax=Hypsibius exemplaris TaxID=2072580 RepID=A0A9X6NFV6_HYPEX|nr:hypothetical protein BV898_17589 [Hypsibius exemplaris]